MKLHHLGVACQDISRSLEELRASGLGGEVVAGPLADPLQDASLCLVRSHGTDVELVSGPAVAGLLKKGMALYHVCWEVEDLDASLASLEAQGGMKVSEPKPAVLFGGRRVAFVRTPMGLVELLEAIRA
jgi:methylmalonyl-CoA/ethylmalonyl-CoA epimerase